MVVAVKDQFLAPSVVVLDPDLDEAELADQVQRRPVAWADAGPEQGDALVGRGPGHERPGGLLGIAAAARRGGGCDPRNGACLEQALARRVTVDRRVPGAGPVNELHRRLAHRRISAVGLDLAALEGLRQMILADGPRQLAVGDLRADDLA